MVTFPYKMVITIVCVLILVFSDMHHVPASSSYEPLQAGMLAMGAKVEEWNIHALVRFTSKELAVDSLKEVIQEVIAELGIDAATYEWREGQKVPLYIVQAEAIDTKLHVFISAQILSSGLTETSPEGYLVVNVEGKNDENISIKEIEEKIMNITKKKGHSPQINTCLIGWLDGKLRDGEWHGFLQKAFAVTHAKKIDQLETEHFASYTGFTPDIDQWLQIGDQRINLNIAVHYNQSDHRTYVTIGSPVITREY